MIKNGVYRAENLKLYKYKSLSEKNGQSHKIILKLCCLLGKITYSIGFCWALNTNRGGTYSIKSKKV